MAKPNYSYEKRQREIAKKKKQEEKRRRKAEKSAAAADEQTGETPEATAPEARSDGE